MDGESGGQRREGGAVREPGASSVLHEAVVTERRRVTHSEERLSGGAVNLMNTGCCADLCRKAVFVRINYILGCSGDLLIL